MHKLTAITLIDIFQKTIVELSAKVLAEKHSMPAMDYENANIVLSMSALNKYNLEQVLKQGDQYYVANRNKVDHFLATATVFADSLMEEGYGFNVLVYPSILPA